MNKILRLKNIGEPKNEWIPAGHMSTFIDPFTGKRHDPNIKNKFDRNTIIWRYLDFSKFISLLEEQIIHFTRLDNFYDRYEGLYPPSDYEKFNNKQPFSTLDKKLVTQLTDISVRLGNYASCWHINDDENYGMWKSYVETNQGVAIQSTVGNLMDSLNECELPIAFGNVEYVDINTLDIIEYYKRNISNGYSIMPVPSFFKRKSFSFEKEFRAVIFFEFGISSPESVTQEWIEEIKKNQKKYYQVPVDLNKLINKLIIHPDSPQWFDTLVQKVIDRYMVKFHAYKSEI